MKIELKNIKYAAFASEETSCFEATVYVDGKKAGQASNDGRGGMTWVEPPALRERIDEYGKTLPPLELGDGLRVDQDAETLIDGLLHDWLTERDFKRLLKRVTIRVPTDPVGSFRTVSGKAGDAASLAFVAKNFPDAIILNNLPYDQALAIYKGVQS